MSTLLVIDDEELISEFVKNLVLTGPVKFDLVKTANDAIQGLREFKKLKPDIVITDIRMPEMDGLTLINEFKKYDPEVIVIILTGYNEFEYAKKAIGYGVFEYILKPIEEDIFFETIYNAKKVVKKRKESAKIVNELKSSVKKLNDEVFTFGKSDKTDDTVNTFVDNIKIDKVIKYINENYALDLSQEEVAEKVFISSSYLSELFKRFTGKNFITYVTEIKIEKAKKLLECQNLKIQEISHLVGYRNVSYFIRVFNKHMGVSPNEYREMLING